ncbi:MAG: iron ABC transporter permease [Candidatus Competibacteraceae bacterium]
MTARHKSWTGWLAAGLIVLGVTAFAMGPFPIELVELMELLWSRLTGAAATDSAAVIVLFQIRLPRVLGAMLAGAALAAAGAAYQGLFRNPLVSPDILGVSAGAALGAVLGIFLSLPVVGIQVLAFGGGLLTVVLVYGIANLVRGHEPVLILVLAGIVLGALTGACISLLKILADPYDQLPAITYWLLGSLAAVTPADIQSILPAVGLGLLPLYLLRWRLNLLSLSEEEARALGLNTAQLRLVVVSAATLMTAAVVSISGIIGWVGLIIPHIARLLVGPNFIALLPTSMLLGAIYLLLVDTLARSLTSTEVPLGILTALLGAPFFLWLLASGRRGWQ